MVSAPAQWIDEVIRSGAAPLLKQHGYRKRGRKFVRDNAESTSHVEFQASQWNGGGTARFTINLGSRFPSLELAEDDSARMGFGGVLGSIGTRIGHLMPAKEDYWWAISPTSGHEQCAADVYMALASLALPWLERVSSIRGLAEHGRYIPLPMKLPSLAAASALAVSGQHAQAMELLAEYQAMPFHSREYARVWMNRYGARDDRA